jgi:hypothetical protein
VAVVRQDASTLPFLTSWAAKRPGIEQLPGAVTTPWTCQFSCAGVAWRRIPQSTALFDSLLAQRDLTGVRRGVRLDVTRGFMLSLGGSAALSWKRTHLMDVLSRGDQKKQMQ